MLAKTEKSHLSQVPVYNCQHPYDIHRPSFPPSSPQFGKLHSGPANANAPELAISMGSATPYWQGVDLASLGSKNK